MTRKQRRGAGLATYAVVVGLVGIGVIFALRQTGSETRGLVAATASTVNAVDGAVSGNRGPVFEGTLPPDVVVDAYDPLPGIEVRGFRDPEGDRLSFSLSTTGELGSGGLRLEPLPDGGRIVGTPDGDGAVEVIATDPIGRTAASGRLRIEVVANSAPVFSGAMPDLGKALRGGSLGPVELPEATDENGDDVSYSLADGGSGVSAQFSLSGGDGAPLTISGTPATDGTYELYVIATDGHGLAATSTPVTLQVLPPCGEVVPGGLGRAGSLNCYVFQADELVWNQAVSACAAKGGHLATIADAGEDSFVANTVAGGERAYIGFSDAGQEGLFRWVTGEPTTYTGWLPGEPNDSQARPEGEDCGETNFSSLNGGVGWNDIRCTYPMASVCEIER